MTIRHGGGPGTRADPYFRSIRVTSQLLTAGRNWVIEDEINNFLVFNYNTWGALFINSTDNGLALQYNGNTRVLVGNSEVQIPDNGQGNGLNVYNSALVVNRGNRRSGIQRAIGDLEVNCHIQSQNLTANARNTALLLHNHANVDNAVVGLGFKVDSNVYSSETRVKTALVYERHQAPSIGALHVVNAVALNDNNYHPVTDRIATWAPTGHYGVGTTAPPVALSVGVDLSGIMRAVGVAATAALAAPTNFAAGTESAGGSLTQNGLYQYRIVALDSDGLEHGTPSAQIQKQLPNSGGNTWQIPLSWDAVSGATGYRIYFRNANGSGAEFGWQYFDVGAVTATTHTSPSGTAVRWYPLGHGALDARLSATGWVAQNWGVGLKTFGGGTGVLAVRTTTAPTAAPPNGWYIYVDPATGDLVARSALGNIRTLATA